MILSKFKKGDLVKFTFNEKEYIGIILKGYVESFRSDENDYIVGCIVYSIRTISKINNKTLNVDEDNIIEQL